MPHLIRKEMPHLGLTKSVISIITALSMPVNSPGHILPSTSQSRTKRKNERKFLFSHFFVVPQKVLRRPLRPS